MSRWQGDTCILNLLDYCKVVEICDKFVLLRCLFLGLDIMVVIGCGDVP